MLLRSKANSQQCSTLMYIWLIVLLPAMYRFCACFIFWVVCLLFVKVLCLVETFFFYFQIVLQKNICSLSCPVVLLYMICSGVYMYVYECVCVYA